MTSTEPDPSDFVVDLLRNHKELIPTPYGQHEALDQSGSVATPLMAGFALTMASIVLTSADRFRWSNVVLLLLTIAVVSLLMSVQAAQSTRAYRVRPDEVLLWWPRTGKEDRAAVKQELTTHDAKRQRWSTWQRVTYRIGLLALLAGLPVALVPPIPAANDDAISWVRWLAVAVGALGFVIELAWTAKNVRTSPATKSGK